VEASSAGGWKRRTTIHTGHSGVTAFSFNRSFPIAGSTAGNYRKVFGILKTDELGKPFQVFDVNPQIVIGNIQGPKFTLDGRAVVYAISGEKNQYNLWLQPLDGKPGRQPTHFPSDQIYGFGWSPDGKKLLVGRGHQESDVVLLRDTSK